MEEIENPNNANEILLDEEYLRDLIDETKDYINDLLVCLEKEDYEMLGNIEATYNGLLDDLENLPEGATNIFSDEWEEISDQLSELRDIMEERRENLMLFIENSKANGVANKAYMRAQDIVLDDIDEIKPE